MPAVRRADVDTSKPQEPVLHELGFPSPLVRRILGWALRICLALLPTLGVALMLASPASAHFKLERTVPGDGARLASAVEQISLRLSAAGVPIGTGFTLVDGGGDAVPATRHTPDGGRTWLVHPATPLRAGVFTLTWRVPAWPVSRSVRRR